MTVFFISNTSFVSAESSVPRNGLVWEWLLNGNANDTSGNGNNGTASDVTWVDNWRWDGQKVASFNGSSSYIQMTSVTPNNSDFTFSNWFNLQSFGSSHRLIFSYWLNNYGDYGIGGYINPSDHHLWINTLKLSYYDLTEIDTWFVPTIGTWYHLTIMKNGSTETIFINGNPIASISNAWSGIFSSGVLGIGKIISMSGLPIFDGYMSSSRLYNRALSSSEIQALYNDGIQPSCSDWIKNQDETSIDFGGVCGTIPRNGLVWEWLLNGNANDTSGNGNNGTASNVSWVDNWRWDGKKAASFNGNNSYISNLYKIQNWSYFSLSLWVKYWNWFIISWWWDWEYYSFILWENSSGLYYMQVWLGWTWWWVQEILQTNSSINDWKWHHIVLVRENWDKYIYLDSIKIGSKIWWTTSIITINKSISLSWRYNGYSFVDLKQQNLQLARWYNNTILSPSEIQALYNEWASTISNSTSTTTPTSLTNPVLSNPIIKYDFTETTSKVFLSNLKQSSNTTTADKNITNAADPITLSKGEFTYDNTLMSIPGKKLPYEFKLSYKNQLYYNGPVGIDWDHNYNMYLTGETNGNVLYYNGKLGVFRFTQNGGIFDYNEGLKANLTLNGSIYTINYDNGDKYTFDSAVSGSGSNKISRIEDINGNNLNFAYSGGLLSTVTDTLGRNISYSYYDHNRLKDVTDFNGHKVTMNYFTGSTDSGSLYDLQSVEIDNGGGMTKTISFEYSTGGTDTTNHAITKLIDSKWQVYVENTYDTGSRVTSQKYGSGTLTYSYTLSGSSIAKNTVIDKLGNKTEYTYDDNGNQTQVKYFNPAQTSFTTYTYEYNTLGYMTKETKPRGNGFTYTYDSKGNLMEKRMKSDTSAVNSSSDLVTAYTYDSNNNLLTQTNPNVIGITNTYDSNNNLLSKTVSGITSYSWTTSNITTNYTYLSGFLDTTTDSEGNVTRFQYSSGLLSKIIRWAGSITSTGSFVYDSYGNPTASTDGEGWTKYWEYNSFNLLSTGTTAEWIVTSYEYDANNNKIKETRYLPGGTTVNSYFSYDILDHVTANLVDTAIGKTLLTTFKYDENGNIIEKKVGSGALVKYSYNEFGKVTSERIVVSPNSSSEDIITGYTYDSNGNMVTKINPMGNITTYAYDLYDRVTQETNPKGTYTLFVYNKDGSVNTKSVYDSENIILSKSTYLYDGLGNIVKSTDYLDPANNAGALDTKIAYDKNGKKISITDPKGNTTQNTYDSLGRLSSTTDALGNTVSYSYDRRDLATTKIITPNTGTGIATTTSVYDHDGRLTGSIDNLGQTKTIIYNNLGQTVKSTDEANHVTDYEYDYIGKTTKEIKYLSGETSVVTTYGYDERENLTSITDPNNNTTTYAYDGINRNTSVTYPDGKQLIYVYDKNSNVTSQTDPNGTTTTNTYDTTNLLAGRSISTGTGVIGITSENYTYDAFGRAISGTDSNGNTLAFTYDALGRLVNENSSWSTIGYTYDANGNNISVSSGTGYLTSYSYDDINRLTNVSYNSGNIVNYTYAGILNTGISYANEINTTQTFDSLLRLNTLDNGVNSYVYSYDPVGNITSDNQKNYAYDSIYRLTQVNNTQSGTLLESFNYDKTGNRNSNVLGSVSNTYSGNILNQYLSVTSSGSSSTGSTENIYDNNGNITNNGTYAFQYDYKNRLVKVKKVSDDSIVAQYVYDILGRRIQKLTSTTKTDYVYAGENTIQETVTNLFTNGVVTTNRVFGIGTDSMLAYETDDTTLSDTLQLENLFCLNRVLPYTADFEKYGWTAITSRCGNLQSQYTTSVRKMFFVQKDHLGSTIALTDSSGSVVQEYAYDVYGSPYIKSGTGYIAMQDFTGNLHGNTRLFTGREYDGEIGLYYLRARYYSADTGRFISRDPIGQVDNLNLYAYVQNNPIKYTDPTGRSSKAIIKLFRQSWTEMKDFRSKNEWSWWSNDLDPDLNSYYMKQEFNWLGRGGKYDLAYGGSNIQKDYDTKGTWYVNFDWDRLNLWEISNVLTALNAQRLWFSQEHLENSAMLTVKLWLWNGVEWEMADRKLYDYGYVLWSIENSSWELTDQQIIRWVKEAVKARGAYIR